MNHSILMARRLLALYLAVGLWVLLGRPVQAATITVTTTVDSGAGSLRQALSAAANGDTITFAAELSGATIGVTSGPLTLNKPLTIDGAALPVAVTIDGNGLKQLFTVTSSGVVTLTHLSLLNGKGNYGGALYNGGTLTLDRVTIANGNALSGGAIYNVGTLTMQNSTLSSNRAFSGGAIDNYGSLTMKNSTVSGNSATNTGGGLFNAGTLAFYNTILANSSGSDCLNANDAFFGLVGVIAANVRNLTEDGSCGAALSGDPKLALLAAVDGVLVHVPAADSPVLNAGDNATCLAVDQRQAPRAQGAGCELGAVEVETPINSGNGVTQVNLTTTFSAILQPCATVAAPGLPRHLITPTLQRNAGSGYRDLYFVVTELNYTTLQGDNSPTLCNADDATQGVVGVGARVTLAQTGALADNRWTSGERFAQAFAVGLPVRARYRLFVNLYGVPVDGVRTAAGTLIDTLGWEFDEAGHVVADSGQLFLPLVVR